MLLLGTRQLLQQLTTVPSFDCLGERLLPLRSTIDLGLVVDFHLTFNEHTCIQQLLASCTAKLCQINRVKHVFNHETLNLSIIINAWVIIKIDYCSVIWYSTSENNIQKIQLAQHSAARIITGRQKFDRNSLALCEQVN